MMPTADQVAAFLGRGDDTELVSLAGEHLPVVAAFVRAYTRGNGFIGESPENDLGMVIKTATARLTVNPQQAKRVQVDDYAQTFTTLDGFTLPELAVLNLYRKRAG